MNVILISGLSTNRSETTRSFLILSFRKRVLVYNSTNDTSLSEVTDGSGGSHRLLGTVGGDLFAGVAFIYS